MKNFCLILLILCSGCSSLKAKTGEYVTEAVADHVMKKVETTLAKRGLSIATITSALDLGGRKTTAELVVSRTKTIVGDLIATKLETQSRKAKKDLATLARDPDATAWDWIKAALGLIGGLVATFLLVSDGKRKARLDVLERLLQRDLDHDGTIGGTPTQLMDPLPPPLPDSSG